jgi:predicted flap endonuclease-1-like 5' DNA nuclease
MSLLFRIVYAAHATGTHHKLALDALRHLECPEAEYWQRLFLKYAERYMEGAKAPDNEFKDFKNHVLHVRDGYWGGALGKAEEWYGTLCAAIKTQDWEQVAWTAGVLSHYVTDPIQPFHTGQSDAENSIHRAAEWSISRSYDALRTQGLAAHGGMTIPVGSGATWLRELVINGADKANVHYETLIAHYDLDKGVSDPPAGLDVLSRQILGELLVYASKAFAIVLDRAFEEARIAPPEVDLTMDTVMAAVKIPAKTLAKRLADAEDRRVVAAMYDELLTTGRVEATLPEDDRVVRDLHAAEIEGPRLAKRAIDRSAALAGTPAPKAAAPVAPPAPLPTETPPANENVAKVETLAAHTTTRPAKYYLALTDYIEKAPSIGPRSAKRLEPLGIKTVQDFLSASTYLAAGAFNPKNVTPETIQLWQDQCRLMLAIPGLRGGHAELLAGSGYRSAQRLADAEEAKLCADILAFAVTPPGKRILRDGSPPDIERIKGWLESAKTALAA